MKILSVEKSGKDILVRVCEFDLRDGEEVMLVTRRELDAIRSSARYDLIQKLESMKDADVR